MSQQQVVNNGLPSALAMMARANSPNAIGIAWTENSDWSTNWCLSSVCQDLSEWESEMTINIILICSGTAIVIALLSIFLFCWIRKRRKSKNNSSDSNLTYANKSLIQAIEDTNEKMGKERNRKTEYQSTGFTKDVTNPTFLTKGNNDQSIIASSSRFSINSKENRCGKTKSQDLGRSTQLPPRNRSPMGRQEDANLLSFLMDEDLELNKKLSDPATSEFSVDTFLDQKWDRKRVHHSPENVIRKPRRKSTWKCDLKNMKKKSMKRRGFYSNKSELSKSSHY